MCRLPMNTGERWCSARGSTSRIRPSPVEAASHLEVPILLVHSRQDEQISFRHAERLRAALANNPKAEFDFMDRGRHGEMPAGFEGKLRGFFRRALARGGST